MPNSTELIERAAAAYNARDAEMEEAFGSVFFEVERVYDLGDHAILDTHLRNRGRASGAEVEIRLAQVIWVRDGIAAAEAMTRRWWEEWEQWTFEPSEYAGVGDRVFVRCHFAGRGKRSGVYLKNDLFEVFTLDDARIVRFQMIQDEAAARAAAGLSSPQSE